MTHKSTTNQQVKIQCQNNTNSKWENTQQQYPDEIIPNLFVGSLTHSQSYFQQLIRQAGSYKFGIAILTCTTLPLDLTSSTELEIQVTYGNFKKLEIKDSLDEKISNYFLEAFEFIEAALSNEKIVLVHCGTGISRSPAIIISYLMKKYKITFKEAFNQVILKHPSTDPNENFITQLREYEKKLEI